MKELSKTYMNPNTQPQQTQAANPQDPSKGASQAAANLGFINTMQEHLLQHKANKNKPVASQAPQEAQGQEKEPKGDKTEQPDIAKELTAFKTEIEGLLDSKLGDLKREIETALTEEDANEQTPETTKTA